LIWSALSAEPLAVSLTLTVSGSSAESVAPDLRRFIGARAASKRWHPAYLTSSPGRPTASVAFRIADTGTPPAGPLADGAHPKDRLDDSFCSMNTVGSHTIRANTILPARRRDIELHTIDGLTLVGELALPLKQDPVATLVTLHPLPTAGGFMDSHVFRKASYRLPALADIAVLRFNTRGTTSPRGTSDGSFQEARDERYDVAAAIEFARVAHDPALVNRWLLGWSFGTDLALMYGNDSAVNGAILLSPPLKYSKPQHLHSWASSGKPLVALVPEFDDYLRPDEALARFAAIPQARVVAVPGAKHLWVGESYVRRALNEIVATVSPGAGPLPTTWNGEFTQAPTATATMTTT
jgi:alpha/beta superfamily hydrolase